MGYVGQTAAISVNPDLPWVPASIPWRCTLRAFTAFRVFQNLSRNESCICRAEYAELARP